MRVVEVTKLRSPDHTSCDTSDQGVEISGMDIDTGCYRHAMGGISVVSEVSLLRVKKHLRDGRQQGVMLLQRLQEDVLTASGRGGSIIMRVKTRVSGGQSTASVVD